MSVSQRALVAHPAAPDILSDERSAEGKCIDAALECAQACTSGADACLEEAAVADLVGCLRAQQNCADVCSATASVVSRLGSPTDSSWRALLEACRESCRVCAEHCRRHAEVYDHCLISAEACERCERACDELLTKY